MQIGLLAFFLFWSSPISAVDSSNTITALPSPTAAVTTLPPAQSKGNDTNPCDFTDRWTMLERVVSDWQGYNISLLADRCPNVCGLIYGNGNPDVSGIGVG
jgi:hypothetical protein